jgi:pyruvate dehydrogenase E2 component (dihydrolipoamide acetyltransferase)
MATDVTMPRLSDSMEEGTILKWLVSEGDEVEKGQEIVEIETDKANMTYEADTAGTVVELVASEGDTLDLGEVIARIGDPSEAKSGGDDDSGSDEDDEETETETGAQDEADESSEDDAGDEDEEPKAEEEDEDSDDSGDGNGGAPEKEKDKESGKKQQPQSGGNGASADDGERIKASPVAKRMAKELGVELGDIDGSGPGGRIVKSDVEAAAEDGGGTKTKEKEKDEDAEQEETASQDGGEPEREPAPEPAGDAGPKGEMQTIDLTRLQKTVSRRMAESKATAPDFHLQAEIDMSACVELRKRLKEVTETAPSFNDMVVKACANALREYPRVNGAYRDGHFELYSRVNVGVAVAAQDTLVVPTIFDADKKSLGEVARSARTLITKVRDGKITPPEMSGGTFTVSNLGMYGVDSFSAVINPPQAAIMAIGSLKKRAVVDEESGRIVARDTMNVTLACDHRILYGADGAEFLARVRDLLEQPLALAL